MRIGNRLFPYPVLNRDQNLSSYPEGTGFGLEFDRDESGSPIINDSDLVLVNAHYRIEFAPIEEILARGLVSGLLVVECSASMYRESFQISNNPKEIRIPLGNLNGKVSVSCYLYATTDIHGFGGNGFLGEYDGILFDIEKYDILAVDDGVTFCVDLDVSTDNKVASIFTIVKVEDDESNTTAYESTESGITIQLPIKYYNCYDNIKMYSDYNNIAFAMIAIPALTGCLFDVQSDIKSGSCVDMDDIVEGRRWFNSVRYGFKNATGKDLDIDVLRTMNPFELAQTVLNDASCRGLEDFNELLLGSKVDNPEDMGVSDE